MPHGELFRDRYVALNPIPAVDIRAGMRVVVPVWQRGEVTGYDVGTLVDIDRTNDGDDAYVIVRLPSGREAGYFLYSLAPVPEGPQS